MPSPHERTVACVFWVGPASSVWDAHQMSSEAFDAFDWHVGAKEEAVFSVGRLARSQTRLSIFLARQNSSANRMDPLRKTPIVDFCDMRTNVDLEPAFKSVSAILQAVTPALSPFITTYRAGAFRMTASRRSSRLGEMPVVKATNFSMRRQNETRSKTALTCDVRTQ